MITSRSFELFTFMLFISLIQSADGGQFLNATFNSYNLIHSFI